MLFSKMYAAPTTGVVYYKGQELDLDSWESALGTFRLVGLVAIVPILTSPQELSQLFDGLAKLAKARRLRVDVVASCVPNIPARIEALAIWGKDPSIHVLGGNDFVQFAAYLARNQPIEVRV